MDDMIVKYGSEELRDKNISNVFWRIRLYKMRLVSERCTFKVRFEKFLGFYLIEIGRKVNPDKCEVFMKMGVATAKKEVIKPNRMLISLNNFISRSS